MTLNTPALNPQPSTEPQELQNTGQNYTILGSVVVIGKNKDEKLPWIYTGRGTKVLLLLLTKTKTIKNCFLY